MDSVWWFCLVYVCVNGRLGWVGCGWLVLVCICWLVWWLFLGFLLYRYVWWWMLVCGGWWIIGWCWNVVVWNGLDWSCVGGCGGNWWIVGGSDIIGVCDLVVGGIIVWILGVLVVFGCFGVWLGCWLGCCLIGW